MKELSDYYRLMLSEKLDLKRIPKFEQKEGEEAELTVTFVLPLLNPLDFYRMIVPAMALNRYSEKIRTFLIGLGNETTGVHIDDYNVYLRGEIVEQTDIFVIPFITDSVSQIMKDIYRLNKEAKICMFVDYDWENLPAYHTAYDKFQDPKVSERVIQNIKDVDAVFFVNSELENKVFENLSEKLKGANTMFQTIPLLTDIELLKDVELITTKDQDVFKIGIFAEQNDWESNNYIQSVLKDIQKKHGDSVEINVIGNGLMYDKRNCFRDIKYNHVQYENIIDYFGTISALRLDVGLIPIKDTAFNKVSIDYGKYITFSILQIPVMASSVYPYNHFVKHNERGILCGTKTNWIDELAIAIKDRTKLEEVMKFAFTVSKEYYIVNTPEKLKMFEQIFLEL